MRVVGWGAGRQEDKAKSKSRAPEKKVAKKVSKKKSRGKAPPDLPWADKETLDAIEEQGTITATTPSKVKLKKGKKTKKVEKGAEKPKPKLEETAKEIREDLALECPVCRSLEACACEEDDRTFQRRCRFEHDVKKTARCPRCHAPLSVIYVPRPGTRPPYRLPCFNPVWGCSICHGSSIAAVASGVGRGSAPVQDE